MLHMHPRPPRLEQIGHRAYQQVPADVIHMPRRFQDHRIADQAERVEQAANDLEEQHTALMALLRQQRHADEALALENQRVLNEAMSGLDVVLVTLKGSTL